MRARLTALFCLAVIALALTGCTKCGWIWDDWGHKSNACHSDAVPN